MLQVVEELCEAVDLSGETRGEDTMVLQDDQQVHFYRLSVHHILLRLNYMGSSLHS